MRIYTRTGDHGETGLYGGTRVPKDHPRVEAYGSVDELAATFGWARACELPSEIDAALGRIQGALFRVGAELACSAGRERTPGVEPVDSAEIAWVERTIDVHEAELASLRTFILPGGNAGAAALHLARTVCRRAERRVVAVARVEPVRPEIVTYLNRVGDLCFVLARRANKLGGVADLPWNPRHGVVG
ncbi:MAG: cob(I)yrinic acid a,c-diamide adenosyltransferase [Polyangiaceae bacterium]|nr:cob(I)yrinic acid a,c-diamide adenosyltransferase [Polyangiaceae bacterium]